MPPGSKPKPTKRGNEDQLRSALLDLHEPIAEVRPLAELVLILREAREPIPTAALVPIWKLL